MMIRPFFFFIAACMQSIFGAAQTAKNKISAPPLQLNVDTFYKKHIVKYGIPILSSAQVPDTALIEVARNMSQICPKNTRFIKNLSQHNVRIVLMGVNEKVTDIPEFRDLYQKYPGTDWNLKRGLGPTIARPIVLCAEENVLKYNADPYSNENILTHEFGHALFLFGHVFMQNFSTKLEAAFKSAQSNKIWADTYAITSLEEYFAEGIQDWFDVNAESIPNNGIHNFINTRDELKKHDKKLYFIISEIYR